MLVVQPDVPQDSVSFLFRFSGRRARVLLCGVGRIAASAVAPQVGAKKSLIT